MNPHTQTRVRKEIIEINDDFFNLRTKISPDPQNDVSRFYFIMLPNDGAMAHLPLVGTFYILDMYPNSPPVVHLYTKTGRYNVDIYQCYVGNKTHSTLCFDILRSKVAGGIWKPEYSISTLFASLMSAIVSFYVPQEYGPDQAEYVTMERLRDVKRFASEAYRKYKHCIPNTPEIPLVEAKTVRAKPMSFPAEIVARGNDVVTYGPIYLQTQDQNVYSFAADLSQLHAGIVFSVVLSNSKNDLVGKKAGTVLVRNGVTATAARKRANEKIIWFYHGKPMNDGDMRLHVTIGKDEMTFAYYSNGRRYVHGDCPVSRLTEKQIGDVRGVPFYVNIFLKKKYGEPAKITMLDIDGKGYIHDTEEADDFDFELVPELEALEVTEKDVESEKADEDNIQKLVETSDDDDKKDRLRSWKDILLMKT